MAGAGPRFGPSVSATGINHKVSQGSISEECLAGALSVPLQRTLIGRAASERPGRADDERVAERASGGGCPQQAQS